MATPNIELIQFPMSQFSQYSVDSPPCFTHLLIQSSDPVLQMTHAIGDKVQFKTYPAPCIFLGTKWTALVDDEASREYYEAKFCYGVIYRGPMTELLSQMAVMSEGLGFNLCVAPFLIVCVPNLPQGV